jgi:ATP-dependent DNA helicase RecQ
LPRRVAPPPPAPAPDSPATPAEQALFEALRAWRAGEAKAQSVPPYVIFHDTVLRGIAAGRPTDREALGSLKGVGASKLARYGAAVLAIVRGEAPPPDSPARAGGCGETKNGNA